MSPKVIFIKPTQIDLSCKTIPGYPHNKNKAENAIGDGGDGSNGEPGLPGYNGGNLVLLAKIIVNKRYLNVLSDGGKGGPGQEGE